MYDHLCVSSWMICGQWTSRLTSDDEENLWPVQIYIPSLYQVVKCVVEENVHELTITDVKTV